MNTRVRLVIGFLGLMLSTVAAADCDLLLQHGITNITRYMNAEHAIAYKWNKSCGLDFNSASDSQVARASGLVFGFGAGSGGYNTNQQREKLRKWCDQNADFAESHSTLAEEAETLSVPALSSWEQCNEMSRKQIKINFRPAGEDDQFVHFEVDSTYDGNLKYLGIKSTNYTCEESMVKTANGKSVDPDSQPDIANSNIQIDCKRTPPVIKEEQGVGRMTYDAGYISINTSGPSFSMAFPKVVSAYYVTPPASVVAFDARTCPAGWSPFEPAFGRFIRGIDKSKANNDPDGERAPGSIQEDALKAHAHDYPFYSKSSRGGKADKDRFDGLRTDGGSAYTATTKPAGGVETRPKNVALLFCRKDF